MMDDDDPHLALEIHRQSAGAPVSDEAVRRAVVSVLQAEACRNAELSIAIVDDAEIAVLHNQHLGQTGPTDVITFDLRCASATDPGRLDGEIVVSAETACRLAGSLGHAPEAELLLYIIHGLLHLLGYDDKTEHDAARMRVRQHVLLAELGHPIQTGEADIA